MKVPTKTIAPVLALLGCMGSMNVHAQTPADLTDLVGARGSSGETQMEARGYAWVRTSTVRDQKWSYWWNERLGQCASVATADGRYSTIMTVPALNCDKRVPSAGAEPRPGELARVAQRRPDADSIMLICWGEGRKPGAASGTSFEYNRQSHRYEPKQWVASTTDQFDSAVQVEVADGRGRIHLTGKLVAPIHSGGVEGWWPLDDLRVSQDTITGRYRLNGMNSPRVAIDRRSGRIRIDGIEHFRGDCQAGDWVDRNRRF